MIKAVHIKNFQSHKDSTLEFAPGVNVIVGQSDCGKSAVIRSLRWVAWNKPNGDAYCSTWGGDTSVQIDVDDTFVQRGRTNADNYYKVKGIDAFKAVKTGVPEEVGDILQMDDINIQQQMDSPFLLSNTAGEVAIHFNNIAHLEQIDFGVRNANKKIRALEQELATEEAIQEKVNVRLQTISYLDDFEVLLLKAEEAEEALSTKKEGIITLTTLLNNYVQTDTRIAAIQGVLLLQQPVDEAIALETEIDKIADDVEDLITDIDTIRSKQQKVEAFVDLSALEKEVKNALSITEDVVDAKEDIDDLDALLYDIEKEEGKIRSRQILLEQSKQQLKDSFPEVCPLCNQAVKKEALC